MNDLLLFALYTCCGSAGGGTNAAIERPNELRIDVAIGLTCPQRLVQRFALAAGRLGEMA